MCKSLTFNNSESSRTGYYESSTYYSKDIFYIPSYREKVEKYVEGYKKRLIEMNPDSITTNKVTHLWIMYLKKAKRRLQEESLTVPSKLVLDQYLSIVNLKVPRKTENSWTIWL